MMPAPTRIRIPSIPAATFSTLAWPGSSALRTEKNAITEASRSMLECTASVMIAIEPVIAPAASFSAIRIALERIDRPAARVLLGLWAAGPIPREGLIIPGSSPSGRGRPVRGG
jgi:hypothetical protein